MGQQLFIFAKLLSFCGPTTIYIRQSPFILWANNYLYSPISFHLRQIKEITATDSTCSPHFSPFLKLSCCVCSFLLIFLRIDLTPSPHRRVIGVIPVCLYRNPCLMTVCVRLSLSVNDFFVSACLSVYISVYIRMYACLHACHYVCLYA